MSLSNGVKDVSVIKDWLGHMVGQILGMFYADYGLMGYRDPEWLQGTINAPIGLLHWFILAANIANSKTMTCQPGAII